MPSGKVGVYTRKGVPKNPFPKSFEFNAEYFATLVALPALFHKYPKPFLCLVGISRYYTLDEDAYLEFLSDNDEGMDLLAFIRTADPTKVRVVERQRVENEPRLLESTVRRVVPLLPIALVRDSSELEASDVAPLQPRCPRKRKTIVANVSGPSHPPKKLREDYGALGGASTAATPKHEDKSLADSVPGLNLRTIGAPQKFIIFSDSSHHSGTNIAEAKVDSIVRSSAPAIATVTTVTAAIDVDATATREPVFFDVSGSDFLIGGIRTVVYPDSDLQKAYVPRWSATNGFGLDDSRICHEIEKRKLRVVVDEQAELLKVKDGEIESLKAQLLLKEAEATEKSKRCLREREKNELSVKVTDLSALVKVREHEVSDLDAQVTAIKLQNENLVGQDEKLEEVNEKFNKLHADFVDMALHLKEKFYPNLLTTIFGHRWLLTYGMELAVVKCLNSTEYLSALGAAISKAVEKGMQEGLSAGITHGAEGRQLANVAAYNPYAEADYLFALQHLQNVNFSLIAELKSNKDASVDTIMNLLCFYDVLVERLGLTKSQPHVNQLMVPIHHSQDQRVVGASTLSLSQEVSLSWVKNMRENIAKHVSAFHGMFVPFLGLCLTILPISTDDYEVARADGQGGASVDDETAAVDDMNLFVSNA
nr:transposase (putative), gypsy type [Tanacetum cinerariifolium]